LEGALKYGLRIIDSTNKAGDKLDQLHYLLTSAALNPTPATGDGEQAIVPVKPHTFPSKPDESSGLTPADLASTPPAREGSGGARQGFDPPGPWVAEVVREHQATTGEQANGDRRCLRLYTRDNLPAEGWAEYRKVTTTRMRRIDGPFSVRTRHRGIVTCEDGYLAVDSGGWPYPIAADEHARIYAPAEPEPTPPIPAAVREALERVAREAKDYLDVLDNAPDEASTSELRQALSALPPASGAGERGGVEAPEPRKGCA
jgi:hypothetical protein